MGDILRMTVKNSELRTPKTKLAFLTYPAAGLAPCTLETREDEIELVFESEGLEPSDIMKTRPLDEKLRFLLNVADLEALNAEYSFSLSPANILLDRNLRPWILLRDKYVKDDLFLPKYMALAGALLLPQYGYEDFYQGGADLFNKHELLADLSRLQDIAELKARLADEYDREIGTIRVHKRTVSKETLLIAKILIPALAVLLAVAAFFAVRAHTFIIPRQEAHIAARTAYIAGDYISVQRLLSDIALKDLDHDTKHILSRSYVATEALTDAQRQNILMGLTGLTAPVIYDYWIFLGRLQFAEAQELAQRLGDQELLLFTYLKHAAMVRSGTTMPGDEKAALLEQLERQIYSLRQARDQADGK